MLFKLLERRRALVPLVVCVALGLTAGGVGCVERYPESSIVVRRHTDSTGTMELNERLSQERAESVRSYLISQGVAGDRITATGIGSQYQVASNANEAGRQQNRRVEIEITPNQQQLQRGRAAARHALRGHETHNGDVRDPPGCSGARAAALPGPRLGAVDAPLRPPRRPCADRSAAARKDELATSWRQALRDQTEARSTS